MSIVDVAIVLGLAIALYIGVRHRPLRVATVLLGALGGLYVAVLVFNRLAFLSGNSGRRTLVLGLLTAAVAFLCYDLFSVAGSWTERRWRLRRGRPSLKGKIVSGILTGVFGLIAIWLAASMFGSMTFLEASVQRSRILAVVGRLVDTPAAFRQVAHLLSPFSSPRVFTGAEPTFDDTATGDITGELNNLDSAVAGATPSVVKVNAWGCGSVAAGSGFLVSQNAVVTNAHVVAGAGRMSVQDAAGTYVAQTVWFDPLLDIAVLHVETALHGQPLALHTATVPAGTIAEVMGYPEGGGFAAGDVIILQTLHAEGYDIYDQTKIVRNIYALRGSVVPGNSGGPLLGADGKVLGLVFGHATTQNRTGYAIAAGQIADAVQTALTRQTVVGNGSCTSH